MADISEGIRRQMVTKINAKPNSREAFEARFGHVWDTGQLTSEFEVIGFKAPFAKVRRLIDGVVGSIMFQDSPRYFFGFEKHKGR